MRFAGLFRLAGAAVAVALVPAVGSAATAVPERGAARMPVVVVLRDPAGGGRALSARSAISSVQQRLVRELGADLSVTDRWQAIPGLAGRVTQRGLARLRASPLVRAVGPARRLRPKLTESLALIKAPQVHAAGVTGQGVTVAVLDSGVDTDHPDLSDDIVAQECFVRLETGAGGCPNGTARQSGPGSAEDDEGHGTTVTAAISSRGTTSPRGVAPDAKVVAAKVLAADGFAGDSDILSALDWLLVNRLDIRIINLSLGGPGFPGTCDTAEASTIAYASAFSALRRRGATVFVASGNDGSSFLVGSPACVSSAVAVGAVHDSNVGPFTFPSGCSDASTAADKIACYTNSGSALDLLAPGSLVTAAQMGGGSATFAGTSLAAPQAAGAAALLLQARPGLSSEQVESALKQSGKPVADPRNGLAFPRIDAAAAVGLVASLPAAPAILYLPSATATYPDGAGEAIDIAAVDVGTSGTGLVTVTVRISNRAVLAGGESIEVDFDVDRNRSTGSPLGGDIGIAAFPSEVRLYRWSSGRWDPVRQLGESSFSSGTLTVRLTEDELGTGGDFDFSAATFASGTATDRLPDSGTRPYPAFPVAVAKTGTGAGTVSGGGLDCGAQCSVPVGRGASVLLAATPASGSAFVEWLGACSGSGSCTVTATGPVTVTARFEALRRLTVGKAGTGRGAVTSASGTISCGSSCAADFVHGTAVTLAAAPEAGSRLTGWAGACGGAGPCVVTMDGTKNVTATFADVAKPSVRALASAGRRGRTVRLRYRAKDNSGRSRVALEIFGGARRVGRIQRPAAAASGAVASTPWRVPRALGAQSVRFCARATDAAGNRSVRSCARLRLS